MGKNIAQLAREALDIQDACNLSGLIHGWSRSIDRLREVTPNMGTDFYNRHPINQLWASKVHDLTGMGMSDMESFSKAYDSCKALTVS